MHFDYIYISYKGCMVCVVCRRCPCLMKLSIATAGTTTKRCSCTECVTLVGAVDYDFAFWASESVYYSMIFYEQYGFALARGCTFCILGSSKLLHCSVICRSLAMMSIQLADALPFRCCCHSISKFMPIFTTNILLDTLHLKHLPARRSDNEQFDTLAT